MPEPPKPKISAPNTVNFSQLVTGCKVYVSRPSEGNVSRKAEILSSREKKLTRAEKKAGDAHADGKLSKEDTVEYYVHYVEFNKVCCSLFIPFHSLILSLRRCRDWTSG